MNFRVSISLHVEPRQPPSSRAMQLLVLLGALCTLLSPTYALYFYLEGSQMRCFLEDLPKDTLVVGAFLGSCPWTGLIHV